MKQESDLYLIDEDIALIMSAPEITGMLTRMLQGCHRCIRYFAHYDQDSIQVKYPVTKAELREVDFASKRIPRDQEFYIDYY